MEFPMEQLTGLVLPPRASTNLFSYSAASTPVLSYSPMDPSPAVTRSKARLEEKKDHEDINSFLQAPLVEYPHRQQPRPAAGDVGYAEWRPGIYLQKTWRHDELNDIAKDLPDPTKDAADFVMNMVRLVRQYKPSAAEVAHILGEKLQLRWGLLPEPAYRPLREVKDTTPKIDWADIHSYTQNSDECLDDYWRRLENCFRQHRGMGRGEEYNHLLKNALVNRL